MNYLAHLYLAEPTDEGLVGSLLGDFVKGRLDGGYTPTILDGIRLHRRIDVFTDTHPVAIRSRGRFSGERRRFAGIIIDMCYDHFLTRHWRRYSDVAIGVFIERAYAALERHHSVLPSALKTRAPRMIRQNWLASYASMDGIDAALAGISRRLTRPNPLADSAWEIEQHYTDLEADFRCFFPQAVEFARVIRKQLMQRGLKEQKS